MTTTAPTLYYNYAVVDHKYPGEPHYWGLSGFTFGDAATHGWTFEFAPGATKTTDLVQSNLRRKDGRITLAIPMSRAPTKEPKWGVGLTWAQILIKAESDDEEPTRPGEVRKVGEFRKIGLYKVRVLAVGKETDSHRHRIFKHPVQVILCHVTGGGYVAGDKGSDWTN